MRRIVSRILLIGLAAPLLAAWPSSAQVEDPPSSQLTLEPNFAIENPPTPAITPTPESKGDVAGVDQSRPLARFDFRFQFQQKESDLHAWIVTLRLDAPFELGNGWKLGTRFELPLVNNNHTSLDNPNGDSEFGMGDILSQFLLITPHEDRWAAAVGARVVWPTATADQFGNGHFQLGPTLVLAHYPDWLLDGSYFGVLIRDEFNFGRYTRRSGVHEFVVQPAINLNLPEKWYVNFAPEMKMNRNHNKDWFIPFDVQVGKKLDGHTVISVEYKQGLLKDYDVYDWEVEFRIGFLF